MSGAGVPDFTLEDARDLKLGVVASRWHTTICDTLVANAERVARAAGVDQITVVRCAGAMELPVVAQALARSHDAVVALGVVIRGETPHFEYISNQTSLGIGQAALETGIPITFGVITVNTDEQAIARSGNNIENKGYEAAMAAVEMVQLLRQMS